MLHAVFEFNTEKEMRDTAKLMWDHYNISGEMAIRPLPAGRWRMELNSEKDIRDATLEKFAAYKVEAGD